MSHRDKSTAKRFFTIRYVGVGKISVQPFTFFLIKFIALEGQKLLIKH